MNISNHLQNNFNVNDVNYNVSENNNNRNVNPNHDSNQYNVQYNAGQYGDNPINPKNANRYGIQTENPEEKYTEAELRSRKRSGLEECETCKNRKYQDGSDEMVSFKTPGHIDPKASASVVRAHEQEHVNNAYKKANGVQGKDGEVVSANVTLKNSICPECGRSYVSGGETVTQIKYKEDDQYALNAKLMDMVLLQGNNVDVKC